MINTDALLRKYVYVVKDIWKEDEQKRTK
jgi:hypothetical protein